MEITIQKTRIHVFLLASVLSMGGVLSAQGEPKYPFWGEALSEQEARELQRDLDAAQWRSLENARAQRDASQRTWASSFEDLRRTSLDFRTAQEELTRLSQRRTPLQEELARLDRDLAATRVQTDQARAALAAMDADVECFDRAIDLFRFAARGYRPAPGEERPRFRGRRGRNGLAEDLMDALKDPAQAHWALCDLEERKAPLARDRHSLARTLADCNRALRDLERRHAEVEAELHRCQSEYDACERRHGGIRHRFTECQAGYQGVTKRCREHMDEWNSCLASARRQRLQNIARRPVVVEPVHGGGRGEGGGRGGRGEGGGRGGRNDGGGPVPGGSGHEGGGRGPVSSAPLPTLKAEFERFYEHVNRLDRREGDKLKDSAIRRRPDQRLDERELIVANQQAVMWAAQRLSDAGRATGVFEARARAARRAMGSLGYASEFDRGDSWFFLDVGQGRTLAIRYENGKSVRYHICPK